ncbi:MAG: glycosyltransferase family 1 protein [Mogibacterium sp.]|nr:glycosyltransferase family 1 protein [Mogibacterium sp.]
MMRVLQVVTDMNRGGLETMLMNYYRHIDRENIQFDFLTHRPYEGEYGSEIGKLGGTVYHLPRLNPFSPGYRRALNAFFAGHKEYRIVHVHQDCMSSVILKYAKKNGVPVRIAHSHTSDQEDNYKYPIKLYYRRQIPRYATELAACSRKAGDWMFGGAEYILVNNAIDAEKFEFDIKTRDKIRKEYGFDDELVLGHVGSFSKAKNHDFLIDVFQKANKRLPARLMLIGEGALKDIIEAKAHSLGLSDRIVFAGKRDDVAELMQAMDIFAFPSLFEGLPLSLVEAQAAGLPCYVSEAVSDESSVSDIVKRLPLSAGAETWAEVIYRTDISKRRQMSDEIRRAGYDIKENARKLEEFYLSRAEEV